MHVAEYQDATHSAIHPFSTGKPYEATSHIIGGTIGIVDITASIISRSSTITVNEATQQRELAAAGRSAIT